MGNATHFAEIAQLVEHNLAKVGVASSSLVFRSKLSEAITIPQYRTSLSSKTYIVLL